MDQARSLFASFVPRLLNVFVHTKPEDQNLRGVSVEQGWHHKLIL